MKTSARLLLRDLIQALDEARELAGGILDLCEWAGSEDGSTWHVPAWPPARWGIALLGQQVDRIGRGIDALPKRERDDWFTVGTVDFLDAHMEVAASVESAVAPSPANLLECVTNFAQEAEEFRSSILFLLEDIPSD